MSSYRLNTTNIRSFEDRHGLKSLDFTVCLLRSDIRVHTEAEIDFSAAAP
ncbi:hypothetical protein EST38_g11853 [Candolleomyces aberdarensis]|uniref:Uncharacterized protein n=1 Tax=Candolleomyces aberdarensis TaxID=2316362 RepID=A0A4Q2D3W6_9AGAR|nr:hypothetical protein EST38_g11853 [Candolleomyces aberdarensis]